MKWTFDANQYDANKTFELIPVGEVGRAHV